MRAIKRDKEMRKSNTHTRSILIQKEIRINEYIDFLLECKYHAEKVGDYSIARKLNTEISHVVLEV